MPTASDPLQWISHENTEICKRRIDVTIEWPEWAAGCVVYLVRWNGIRMWEKDTGCPFPKNQALLERSKRETSRGCFGRACDQLGSSLLNIKQDLAVCPTSKALEFDHIGDFRLSNEDLNQMETIAGWGFLIQCVALWPPLFAYNWKKVEKQVLVRISSHFDGIISDYDYLT